MDRWDIIFLLKCRDTGTLKNVRSGRARSSVYVYFVHLSINLSGVLFYLYYTLMPSTFVFFQANKGRGDLSTSVLGSVLFFYLYYTRMPSTFVFIQANKGRGDLSTAAGRPRLQPDC